MRAFAKGELFMDVPCEQSFRTVDGQKYDAETPVFSEAFLYHTVGKDNARFILAVAEEYDIVIRALGTEKVKEILEQNRHLHNELRR